jgi:hypothetical protein
MPSKDPHRARREKARAAHRRRGKPTPTELALVEAVCADQPGDAAVAKLEEHAEHLAIVLRRDPKTVKGWIAAAREKLQSRALEYVDAHWTATNGALAEKQYDVAGRLAWQAIERLSDNVESSRVVEPAKQDAAHAVGVQVQINGLVLGGAKPASSAS